MSRSLFSLLMVLLLSISLSGLAQKEIALYPEKIPNSKLLAADEETTENGVVRKVSTPTLSVFLPKEGTGNGTSVIICPGGGYGILVIEREGYKVAKAFSDAGVTAFVLKYRLPSNRTMEEKSIGPLQDAQQAIKTVREKAREWNINPEKIGIMGFSAGGHLASTAGTHFDTPLIENTSGTSLRPDYMVLVYPVISFLTPQGHKGSITNLVGTSPSQETTEYFSSQLHVKPSTPPTFLTHAGDDTVVPVSNSILFYEALLSNKVPADLHIYSKGEHGYLKIPSFNVWFDQCLNWMKTNQFLP